MAEKKLNLLADFPEITTEKWMEKITVDLKGADFAKKLVWRTDEGFEVMPFYRQGDVESLKSLDSAPGKFPYVRGTKANNDWFVRQDIEVEEYSKTVPEYYILIPEFKQGDGVLIEYYDCVLDRSLIKKNISDSDYSKIIQNGISRFRTIQI